MVKLKSRKFTTAQKFLDALRPSKWVDENQWESEWLFRGHGDSRWELKPVTFRWDLQSEPDSTNETQILLHKTMNSHRERVDVLFNQEKPRNIKNAWNVRNWDNEKVQKYKHLVYLANAENAFLSDFTKLLDKLGLESDNALIFPNRHYIPEITDYAFFLVGENRYQQTNRWESSTIAIAQHHGIPTRLLDWTKNPLVAIYFACEGANKSASHISVFAFKVAKTETNRVKVFEIPKHHSSYIHVQQGVFTIDRLAESTYINRGHFPSLEEDIQHEFDSKIIASDYSLVKYSLPISESGKLLQLLWLEGITRAHLMPTMDNVVNALKTRWALE